MTLAGGALRCAAAVSWHACARGVGAGAGLWAPRRAAISAVLLRGMIVMVAAGRPRCVPACSQRRRYPLRSAPMKTPTAEGVEGVLDEEETQTAARLCNLTPGGGTLAGCVAR